MTSKDDKRFTTQEFFPYVLEATYNCNIYSHQFAIMASYAPVLFFIIKCGFWLYTFGVKH